MKTFLTALAAVALAIVVASCATKPNPYFETKVEQTTGVSPDSDHALVILGLATNHKAARGLVFGNPDNVGITFQRIDEETGALEPVAFAGDTRRFISISRGTCGLLGEYPFGCDHDLSNMIYDVVKVVPGEYMLAHATKRLTRKVYTRSGEGFLLGASVEENKATGGVPWMEVKAGEIVYIGDFLLNASGDEARLVGYQRDDEAARAVRAKLANATGEMTYREPNGLKF